MVRRTSLITFVALFLLVTWILPASSQPAPAPPPTGITTRILLQTTTTITGQPLAFPLFRNQVLAGVVDLEPGGQTGRQQFNVPVLIYMLEGALTIEFEGQAPRTLEAGQVIVPPLRLRGSGTNRGAARARYIFVAFGDARRPVATPAEGRSGFRFTIVLQTTRTWTGEDIVFPLLANQLTAVVGDFAPGAANVLHTHPPTQFIYILEGALTVEPEGRPARAFNPGQAAVEATVPHVGANRGSVAARFFTVFAGEAGVPLTVNVRR